MSEPALTTREPGDPDLVRDVLLVTDLDPAAEHTDGFAGRLRYLLAALDRQLTVDVLILDRPGVVPVLAPSGDASPDRTEPEVGARVFRTTPIPDDPVLERSARGSIRRLWHYSVGRLPVSSYPDSVPQLDALVGAHRYGLVVYHLPQTAHLALGDYQGPQLCLLEEALERRYLDVLAEGIVGRVKKEVVARGEIRRWARLYHRLAERGIPVVAISDVEKAWYERRMPPAQVFVVPHFVDVEYYSPGDWNGTADLDVAVFGNFAEERNLSPVLDILRAATTGQREWRWAVVGRQRSPVPVYPGQPLVTRGVDDVRPFYRRSKVVVVPAFGGSGVKTTLLQAWSMCRPVVATPDAIRGLEAEPGVNVLVGSTPQEILDLCQAVLASSELQERLAVAGRRAAERAWAGDPAGRFAALCRDLIQRG